MDREYLSKRLTGIGIDRRKNIAYQNKLRKRLEFYDSYPNGTEEKNQAHYLRGRLKEVVEQSKALKESYERVEKKLKWKEKQMSIFHSKCRLGRILITPKELSEKWDRAYKALNTGSYTAYKKLIPTCPFCKTPVVETDVINCNSFADAISLISVRDQDVLKMIVNALWIN
jgi:hypothetical protein